MAWEVKIIYGNPVFALAHAHPHGNEPNRGIVFIFFRVILCDSVAIYRGQVLSKCH